MKKILLLLCILLIKIYSSAQSVGISTNGDTPDDSAMLDISSNSKGLLIPRLTNTEVTSISTPAIGLLVFNTDLGNFQFYDGMSWNNFGSGNKIIDQDGDTYINVEYTSDNDSILFVINNNVVGVMDEKSFHYGASDGSVFIGKNAGKTVNLTNSHSVGIGFEALMNDSTGWNNTAVGYKALSQKNAGDNNVAIGGFALEQTQYGDFNVGVGHGVLQNNSSGSQNALGGFRAGYKNISGSENVVLGYESLYENTAGSHNTALGFSTLHNATESNNNIAIGHNSGQNLNGNDNILLGNSAGANASGSHNIFIGNGAGDTETGNNKFLLQNDLSDDPLIAGDFSTNDIFLNGKVTVNNTYSLPITAGISGNVLQLNSNSELEWAVDGDKNSSNELQNLILTGNVLKITNGNSITLPTANIGGVDDLADARYSTFYQSIFIGNGSGAASSGYSNTAIGDSSMLSNTTGDFNTANGYRALHYNTIGHSNTAIGSSALVSNTSGFHNTALGRASISSNTTGNSNTATGYSSLQLNTDGSYNSAFGFQALRNNTLGDFNVAVGYNALLLNTTGNTNIALGLFALKNNTTRSHLVAIGDSALYNNGVGATNSYESNGNTAIGSKSLFANTIGYENTAIGYQSLYNNASGYENTANGYQALYDNDTGSANTANGALALSKNTTGNTNTASGAAALFTNTIGNYNSAFGVLSLNKNTSGNYNTAIGYSANASNITFSNTTALGYNAEPGASNTIRLGNNAVSTIGGYANWTNVSDGRFKTNVQDNIPGLDFITKLRPVSYQLDMDAIATFNKTPDSLRLYDSESLKSAEKQTGFIAQEVETAAKSIGFDFHGVDKPKNETSHYGLRYAEFVVPLVKAVQEQQAIITNYELRMENYEAEMEALKAQNSEIMAQVEMMLKKMEEKE